MTDGIDGDVGLDDRVRVFIRPGGDQAPQLGERRGGSGRPRQVKVYQRADRPVANVGLGVGGELNEARQDADVAHRLEGQFQLAPH